MIGETYPGHSPVPPGWMVLYTEMAVEPSVASQRVDFCTYSCLRQYATQRDDRLEGVVLPPETPR